jgi:uncharacterized protein YndB with AHSA1/START domain
MTSSSLVIKKPIIATSQQIFEAWSNPEIMQKWLFPWKKHKGAAVTNDFKVGGHYKLDMFGDDGVTYTHTGVYKEIILNKKIIFTWNSDFVHNTLVTIELHPVNGKTEVTLTHDLFPDEEIRGKHQDGWQGCLENLERLFNKK